jgi:hypothetical protein
MYILLITLLSCSSSSPSEEIAPTIEFHVPEPTKALPDDEPMPLPNTGARLYIGPNSHVTIKTKGGHHSTLPITSGVLFTNQAPTLSEAEGVFEAPLLQWDMQNNELGKQLRELLFDASSSPLLYARVHDVTPFEEPLLIDDSTTTNATLVLSLPKNDVSIPIELTVNRTETNYTVVSAPIPLPYSLFLDKKGLRILESLCGDGFKAQGATAEVNLSLYWDTKGTTPPIPRAPARTNMRVTGPLSEKTKPVLTSEPDKNRSFKKEPKPHDLRGGNVRWRHRNKSDAQHRPPPFEER